jgi:hypothetical protein
MIRVPKKLPAASYYQCLILTMPTNIKHIEESDAAASRNNQKARIRV